MIELQLDGNNHQQIGILKYINGIVTRRTLSLNVKLSLSACVVLHVGYEYIGVKMLRHPKFDIYICVYFENMWDLLVYIFDYIYIYVRF